VAGDYPPRQSNASEEVAMTKVLITGTNRGIGSATAIAVARAGHTVYATMRDPARGRALAEIAQRERLPISIVGMDVGEHLAEAAALDAPPPPSAVAATILQIIDNGTLTLRHPVGPGAEGFLGWRASMTDDEWVTWGALPDDAWYDRVGSEFGLDARSKRQVAAAHGA
jgi:NAD(P)-dependent dehydrogenase (short-subunit alcohol dehydrogenase family)